MMFKSIGYLIFFGITLTFLSCSEEPIDKILDVEPDTVVIDMQGLIGGWYHGEDLTRIGASMRIKNLDIIWDAITGRGNSWSAQWEGYITAPETGEITFYAATNREIIVKITGKEVLHLGAGDLISSSKVSMIKGQRYPINVIYLQNTGGSTQFNISWSWSGHEKHLVCPEALGFTNEQAEWWNYIEPPDPAIFDFSKLITVPAQNYFAYRLEGMFAGWPANNGVWSWGNEILVGFELGTHDPDISGGHSMRDDLPNYNVLTRSLDGGITWNIERPINFVDSEIDDPAFITNSPGFNFQDPNFVMRIGGDRYFASVDRGKTWSGPYRINIRAPGITLGGLTSRTDYLVTGPGECLVFLSAETGLVESDYQDRSFCVSTKDGGKTFDFLGWMTQDTESRSVMSSTVRISENHLVSALRRKHEQSFGERPSLVTNWIEAAESKDNGKTWTKTCKIADTDLGERNGNPPALLKLTDGRICVAYGYRDFPYGIRMKVSEDNGQTWGKEIVVRSDGATWDLGYCRMVLNSEGKIVIMYYFTTTDNYPQHIGVSIIDPVDLAGL